jgi:hypothetical protein
LLGWTGLGWAENRQLFNRIKNWDITGLERDTVQADEK